MKGDLVKAKQLQDLLSDADLAAVKLGVAGLKLACSHYYGYGSGRARRPLPDGDAVKLQSAGTVLDKLVEVEDGL